LESYNVRVKDKRQLILVAHNVRSAHNVGSLFRTAEGLGVEKIILTGYTPYPLAKNDERLPHIARKIDSQIIKTALGAEKMLRWQHIDAVSATISKLKAQHFKVAALEQVAGSTSLFDYAPPAKLAIVVGNEVEGLPTKVIQACDLTLEIPMLGRKESFNVVQAAAMALYHCRYAS
jgi:tRNA G18 (ribose-2'-O)-methylase SpoU